MKLCLQYQILFGFLSSFIVNELSKVKRDLEVALKDVLQAMRANDGTSSTTVSPPSLDNLAHVGAEARSNCPIIAGGAFF